MDVLDVGTGSGGTVSIPAAQRGANVTGSDLTPELFDAARARAEAAGVEVQWVQADAESLPFEDASFDRVLSTFGHMFAPRHEQAAAELARVVRPGGVVGTCTWATYGATAEMFKIVGSLHAGAPGLRPVAADVGRRGPHPPDARAARAGGRDLGREGARRARHHRGLHRHVREQVRPAGHGPAGPGRGPLAELHQAYVQMVERENLADDGSLLLEPDYVLTVARKPA